MNAVEIEQAVSELAEAPFDSEEFPYALLEALGVEAEAGSIEELKYVRPSKEIRAAEEAAQRERCEDFDQYKELFDQVKEDLEAGTRQMIRCDNKTDVKIGDLLVLLHLRERSSWLQKAEIPLKILL